MLTHLKRDNSNLFQQQYFCSHRIFFSPKFISRLSWIIYRILILICKYILCNITVFIRHKEQFHFVFPRVFLAYTTLKLWASVMVFNVTLKQYVNHIVAIEPSVPEENYGPAASH